MALYEHVFMVRQDASAGQVEALTDQFKNIITEGGGSIGKSEYWGIKSLTYRIKKNRKAHFSMMNLDTPSDAVAEMERQMQINEDVIRFMTIRVDELEEGPSAMMRSRPGRDDRRGGPRDRGDRNNRGDRGSPKADGEDKSNVKEN
jgi:small subunit ribosomal protein S6